MSNEEKVVVGNPAATTMPVPDYNQSDERKADYIKNRPFYEDWSLIAEARGNNLSKIIADRDLADGEKLLLELEGTNGNRKYSISYLTVDNTGEGYSISDEGNHYSWDGYKTIGFGGGLGQTTAKLYSYTVVKHLEEKFIPKSIARIGDVEAVQSDYNQNDETAKDYIKNRPCYESIICICDYNEKTEYGRINPAVQMNEGITLVKGEHLLFEIIEDGKVKLDEIERLGIDGGDGFFYFKSGRYYSWEEGSNVITVQTWNEAYEISVKITRPGEVKQLDEKFIPDTVTRNADLAQQISETKRYADSRFIEIIKPEKSQNVPFMPYESTYFTLRDDIDPTKEEIDKYRPLELGLVGYMDITINGVTETVKFEFIKGIDNITVEAHGYYFVIYPYTHFVWDSVTETEQCFIKSIVLANDEDVNGTASFSYENQIALDEIHIPDTIARKADVEETKYTYVTDKKLGEDYLGENDIIPGVKSFTIDTYTKGPAEEDAVVGNNSSYCITISEKIPVEYAHEVIGKQVQIVDVSAQNKENSIIVVEIIGIGEDYATLFLNKYPSPPPFTATKGDKMYLRRFSIECSEDIKAGDILKIKGDFVDGVSEVYIAIIPQGFDNTTNFLIDSAGRLGQINISTKTISFICEEKGEVYKMSKVLISDVVAEIDTALNNIIAKYGLGGDV